eukprot:NODE_284_length_10808_cov_1.215613.p3 type:complete len:282 gc:universal NODE_284_length_10808_cov_1.215613:10264-9419(-)
MLLFSLSFVAIIHESLATVIHHYPNIRACLNGVYNACNAIKSSASQVDKHNIHNINNLLQQFKHSNLKHNQFIHKCILQSLQYLLNPSSLPIHPQFNNRLHLIHKRYLHFKLLSIFILCLSFISILFKIAIDATHSYQLHQEYNLLNSILKQQCQWEYQCSGKSPPTTTISQSHFCSRYPLPICQLLAHSHTIQHINPITGQILTDTLKSLIELGDCDMVNIGEYLLSDCNDLEAMTLEIHQTSQNHWILLEMIINMVILYQIVYRVNDAVDERYVYSLLA